MGGTTITYEDTGVYLSFYDRCALALLCRNFI
nr:MAG TPA: hypothetical protein [Bacteriophage sp.]